MISQTYCILHTAHYIEKAFDKICLKHVLNILECQGVSPGIISLIQDIYTNNYARVKTEGKLEGKIPVNQGIRQGDSLSPLLFNIVMNEIIKDLRDLQGYPLRDKNLNIVCYAVMRPSLRTMKMISKDSLPDFHNPVQNSTSKYRPRKRNPL